MGAPASGMAALLWGRVSLVSLELVMVISIIWNALLYPSAMGVNLGRLPGYLLPM